MRIVLLVTICVMMTSVLMAAPRKELADSVRAKEKGIIKKEVQPEIMMAGYRSFPQLELSSENTITDPLIIPQLDVADSIEEERAKAHGLREAVEKTQRFRESLDAFSVVDLPIGVVKSGGEALNYSIMIDRINFTTKGSELTAYMSFTVPNNGRHIAFGGKIPLSKDGGIVGAPRIYLLGDELMHIGSTLVTLKGGYSSNTYVEVDCNGFKGMSIEAVVEFSGDQLIPEDEKGNQIANKRVAINFQTYIQDWNELLVKINIPPFQVKGLDGVGFKIEDAYLDWSDITNPTGFAFPAGYESSELLAGQNTLWKGFFMKKATVRLPSKFRDSTNTARIKVGVENLIIDDTGFSGQAFAENLIKKGNMSGWSYSLDRVKIGFASNQLQQFELKGKITVPVLQKAGKPSSFGYLASRGADGNYLFAVSIEDKLKLPMWAADLTLYPGASITVKEKDDKFYPSATLNGMLSISALSKGPKAELAGVRFEQLVLSTEAPHFRPGSFGFGSGESGSKAGGFPLVIKNIGIKSKPTENKVGISLDVTVNIGGDPAKEGFSGTAGLIVWGKEGEPDTVTTSTGAAPAPTLKGWEFDKVELTAVAISIRKPDVYDLTGSIRFFEEDAVYGDGFKGQLIGKLQEVTVTATALFGKTPTYRYWFADALVEFENGVVLAPGFAAYAFGGGFFSRMKQGTGNGGSLGVTSSGISYIPDENSMGLRAFVEFGGTPSKQAYNGDVTLEIAMNRSGGINTVSLVGSAYFLTPSLNLGTAMIKEGATKAATNVKQGLNLLTPRAQVYGTVNILFDNVNDVFHGNTEVYMNVLGGLVKGIGESNKAGWAVFHFSSDEWYVLIGTPDQPIGLEVARLFKAKSYFMMGKNLPGSPPPPAKVGEILKTGSMDYMRDFNALQSGTALAFGMNFGVDTGDLRFLMFYGRFSAGAGFDIMLKDYGDSYHCEGSTGPMGINGWYANGQTYAYVEGKVGIKVNLKFYKGDYDILAIGAAAILQTKGPNPFWMKGTVGGYYRILGGLVKGNCKFEVTVGKECKPVGESNPLKDVNMIAEVSPVKGSTAVDVFNAPQAAFNVPIGEIFDITDVENKTRSFRARLVEFSLKSPSATIEGTLKWNTTNDVVVMDSRDILPSEKEMKVKVKIVFEERVNYAWQTVLFENKPVEEVVETNFTTGIAPDFIPPSNVEVSYPLTGQYNFYPKEYGQGFIRLKKGQPDLFSADARWIRKARMTDAVARQQYKEFDYAYDEGSKTVNYAIPTDLPLAKVYQFELLNLPRQNKLIDENVTQDSSSVMGDDPEALKLVTKQIEGNLEVLEVKQVYGSEFRTSKYGTFTEKMNSLSLAPTSRVDIQLNVFQLAAYINGSELFDAAEINGNDNTKPLVQLEAKLNGNKWYEDYVYPIVYEGYPLLGIATLSTRTNPDILGIPPIRDVFFKLRDNELKIVDGQPSADPVVAFTYGTIRYNLMIPMVIDYHDIQNKIVDHWTKYPSVITPRLSRLMTTPFPGVRYGSYKINLKYVIPGGIVTSSNYEWELFNRIPDN